MGVRRNDDDDWFDPHLTVGTKLFIDASLMLDACGEWEETHEELVGISPAATKWQLGVVPILRLRVGGHAAADLPAGLVNARPRIPTQSYGRVASAAG
jgi:hypothetical protein